MSWSLNLFIDAQGSLEALAYEMNKLLEIDLTPSASDNVPSYQDGTRPAFLLSLMNDHDMVNDRDMHFEDYTYQFNVWATKHIDWATNRKTCFDFALLSFKKLEEAGRYRLMLTEDMQSKLDSFDPLRSG